MLPEDLAKAVADLQPKRLITVHHSKFALAKHPWYKLLEKIAEAAEARSSNLITLTIGEPVFLQDSTRVFEKWWKGR